MSIRAIVEERIKELTEEARGEVRDSSFPTVTTSLRMPEDLRFKLDLLAWYLGTSRQALLMTVIGDAVSEGLQAFRDVDFRQGEGMSGHLFSVDEAIKEGLQALRQGETPQFMQSHFELMRFMEGEAA